jgi:hypothetical protein
MVSQEWTFGHIGSTRMAWYREPGMTILRG